MVLTFVLLMSGLFVFIPATNAQVNFNLVCVDSVWYEPGNPQLINVRVFNGDTNQINYPSVQIVSPPPANDTIGNPSNFVNFFAHLSNVYLTYTDTITQQGIPDFSGYTFLMHEGFGASTGVISWCNPVSIEELTENELKIFPNPVTEKLFVISYTLYDLVEIYDALGNLIFREHLKVNLQKQITIDISDFSAGIYFIRMSGNRNAAGVKFVKQ